jgi:hypothetical protein
MERRGHWWNGTWGRIGRRDVYLYEDGGRWRVEARLGGAEGSSRWFEHGGPGPAADRIRELLTEPGRWRELSGPPPVPSRHTPHGGA